MSFPRGLLLADVLASTLSQNALGHLRRARVARDPSLAIPPETLRSQLLLGGFPAPDAVIRLEERCGGTPFPGASVLGAGCLLRASAPWLKPRELPQLDGEPLLPVFGDPERMTIEWEEPFFAMGESGRLALCDTPAPPLPAYDSLEHLLEVEALAPLSSDLHAFRVDAHCGTLLAGLVGALPHPPATGGRSAGFVGPGVWVKELRFEPWQPPFWSSLRGTFLLTEELDLVVDAIGLLAAEGYGLGHEGPTAVPPPGAREVVSFVDTSPRWGVVSRIRVAVLGEPGRYVVTRVRQRAP